MVGSGVRLSIAVEDSPAAAIFHLVSFRKSMPYIIGFLATRGLAAFKMAGVT